MALNKTVTESANLFGRDSNSESDFAFIIIVEEIIVLLIIKSSFIAQCPFLSTISTVTVFTEIGRAHV